MLCIYRARKRITRMVLHRKLQKAFKSFILLWSVVLDLEESSKIDWYP